MAPIDYPGAWGKLNFEEKKQKLKISCQTSFEELQLHTLLAVSTG
jgi:hypothetical protein